MRQGLPDLFTLLGLLIRQRKILADPDSQENVLLGEFPDIKTRVGRLSDLWRQIPHYGYLTRLDMESIYQRYRNKYLVLADVLYKPSFKTPSTDVFQSSQFFLEQVSAFVDNLVNHVPEAVMLLRSGVPFSGVSKTTSNSVRKISGNNYARLARTIGLEKSGKVENFGLSFRYYGKSLTRIPADGAFESYCRNQVTQLTCFPYLEEEDFIYKEGSASGLFGLVLDSMINYMTYSNDFAALYNQIRAACEQDPAQVTPLYLGFFPTLMPRVSWKNFISEMSGYRTEFFAASFRRNVLVAGERPEDCFVLSVFDNSIFIDKLKAAYPEAAVSYITRYNEVFDEKTGSAMLVVFDPSGPTKQQCGIVRLTVYDVRNAARRLVEEQLKETEECTKLQKQYKEDVHVRERLIL